MPQASIANQTMPEWLTAVASCMTSAGWEVDIETAQNGLSSDTLVPEQRDAFRAALDDCEAGAGPQPNAGPMTPERAAGLYDHLVSARSCLAGLGFTTSEPPSKTTFVDTILSGGTPWSPFADLPDDVTEQEWADINTTCPQEPGGG